MEQEILFYLLECPRSVSDMIRELTTKELSDDAAERSDEIPRIAGNWFRKGEGYLWRLQDRGLIDDMGRRYAIDREELADRFLHHLGIHHAFPHIDVNGEDAAVADAYDGLVSVETWGGAKEQLRREVLEGERMADVFAFEDWRPLLAPENDDRRVARHALRYDLLASVHFILISTVLKSRREQIGVKMEEGDSYFHWRNRRERLDEATRELADRLVRTRYPGAEQDAGGAYVDDDIEAIAGTFGAAGAALPDDAVDLLADIYLLSLNDGPTLFEQYAKYDHDVHLLFNLLERGWMIASRDVEHDPRTGNVVLPLHTIRSYLDTLAAPAAGGDPTGS